MRLLALGVATQHPHPELRLPHVGDIYAVPRVPVVVGPALNKMILLSPPLLLREQPDLYPVVSCRVADVLRRGDGCPLRFLERVVVMKLRWPSVEGSGAPSVGTISIVVAERH